MPGASKLRKHRPQRWFTALYALLLAVVSLVPSDRLPTIPDWSRLFSPDKLGHFGAYALFALLLSVSFAPERSKRFLWSFLIAVAFGALMEIAQGISGTGRHLDPFDMVANTIGAGLGTLLAFLGRRKNKNKTTSVVKE
jgi:VanZ family protein